MMKQNNEIQKKMKEITELATKDDTIFISYKNNFEKKAMRICKGSPTSLADTISDSLAEDKDLLAVLLAAVDVRTKQQFTDQLAEITSKHLSLKPKQAPNNIFRKKAEELIKHAEEDDTALILHANPNNEDLLAAIHGYNKDVVRMLLDFLISKREFIYPFAIGFQDLLEGLMREESVFGMNANIKTEA